MSPPANQRVMIVEDSAAFRHCLNAMLLKRFPDLTVIEESGGFDALERIKAWNPAMVLMDIRLGGNNGLELTRQIKATHPETFVAIMTSSSEAEYAAASAASGADRFLVKTGMTDEVLARLVREVLGAPAGSPARETGPRHRSCATPAAI